MSDAGAVERVCLLVGRPSPPGWFADAVEALERETDARVALVVRTDDATAPLSLPVDAETVRTTPVLETDGPGISLPDDVVDRIAAETDVVVQNGAGILRGRILTAPAHGVLSYHHGDIRRYRGVITHFWNYLERDETGGVTVLQLTEDLDAGGIVAETTVHLGDCLTWSELESRKQRAGVPLLARAVENLSDPSFEVEVPDEAELGRLYRSSDVTLPVVARYVLLETARTALARYRKVRYLLGTHRR